MTPAEKAKELIVKFYPMTQDCFIGQSGAEMSKQCALIAVEEILNLDQIKPNEQTNYANFYWQQVKQELEKL